jgi:hypothetical protein
MRHIFQKGHLVSEETRRRISEAKIGSHYSLEARKKMSISHKGKVPWNKGTKGVMLAWNKGLKGFQKGRKITWADKISVGKKNSLKSTLASKKAGKIMAMSNIGRKHSQEFKDFRRDLWKGPKNPLWNGGTSLETYSNDWTDTLRESIRERDGYICQECGIHQEELGGFFKQLDIHHIDYDKYNTDVNNLISLCRGCHAKTNSNRDYWKRHFYASY